MLSSITNAHATREQKMIKAVSRNRAVYRFRGPFFVPFLGKQKGNYKMDQKIKRLSVYLYQQREQQY